MHSLRESVAESVKMSLPKNVAQIFALILFTTFTSAQIAELPGWTSCATGPNPATGVQIGVSNCSTTLCTFILGQTYTFSVYATSAVNTNSVLYVVNAAYPVLGSYTILQGDACNNFLLGSCPVVSGDVYLFELKYTPLTSDPTGDIVVQISATDASSNVILCAEFFAALASN